MSGRMWLNPQGNTGGTGGGEGGGSVNWRDIKGKPTSYTPSEHTHKKEEILGLVETLESLSSSEKEFLELLSEKVDKREGYDLSEENFTAELKKKLENIPSNVEIAVESVNGKTGAVVITKQDLELGNVINVRQASQEDLLSFQELTLSSFEATKKELANKVDVEQGKGLSTNDFTNEHKNEIEKNSKGINLVGEALELHMSDLEKHLSDTDRANINNIGGLDDRITANELGIQEGIADLESHKENTNVHIDDVSRGNIDAVPNLIDRITAIEKSIGEGSNVPSDTVFEEIEKGKIYKLGDKIYDVVNGNLISGAMSYRFYKDNADSFLNNAGVSGQPRLVNNHFRIIPTGYYTQLARIFNDNEAFQGMLYNIIDLHTAGETQVTINGRETDPSTSDTTFTDNEITLEINPRHFSRNTRTPKPLKTGRISLNYYYELTANGLGSHYMIGHKITNNVINFIEYEEFDLNVRGKIVYDDSTIEEANNVSVVVRGELSNNIINIEGNTEYGEIIYNIDDGEIFIEEGEEDDKSFNYAGVVFAVSHNTFDKETARRFNSELTYSVDRMEHKHTPIFRNIDLKHYLNAVVDTMPKHNKENVLSQELKAQEDNPLGVANLKNIIVIDSDYDISQIPEGTIVFKKLGE